MSSQKLRQIGGILTLLLIGSTLILQGCEPMAADNTKSTLTADEQQRRTAHKLKNGDTP